MDEKYRLVFRGEIQDDQHPAIVKRRLLEMLKLSQGQLDKLFSGKPVTIRRDVDRATAAKFQAQFRQAGCRLRVLAETATGAAAPAAQQVADEAAAFSVVPNYVPPESEPRQEIQAPEFGLAEVGARILEEVAAEEVFIPLPEFEVAEVGADLLTTPRPVQTVTLDTLGFELAEVGADIGPERADPDVEPPDVSHLQLLALQA